WAQKTDITVDLPLNMKLLPQEYTLHAITIQYNRYLQNATWYYESSSTSTKMTAGICTGQSGYSCTIGNGVLLHKSNESHDYTLTVTWNGEAITSGALSQSNNNGDHVYRFYLYVGNIDKNNVVQRNKYHTIS
uniref:Uncharacterized protein n=1 Tax=Amphimedon queenslandica TaxID=400682 RepID=A0A1X7URX3_AMPQE